MNPEIDLGMLSGAATPFALMYRPGSGNSAIDLFLGEVSEVDDIDRLAAGAGAVDLVGSSQYTALGILPFRQIGKERGYACHDDGRPLLMLKVTDHRVLELDSALKQLPDGQIELTGLAFDDDDVHYADTVRRVVKDEIGNGEGANVVIRRSLKAQISGPPLRAALGAFRRLVSHESGAHWVFLVYVGDRILVGATPERHVCVTDGIVTMNPISGTYRYPLSGPSVEGALRFLADQKEADELLMVVDEELKMMSQICDGEIAALGPYLKEMGHLAHTEFLLTGRSTQSISSILRVTMYAPTVTGSPLENACSVIERHEEGGRSYYAGVLALIGRDDSNREHLDSAIIIRAAEITASGELEIGVGATLVRHSDPDAEAAETHAKVAGLLHAITGDPAGAPRASRPHDGAAKLADAPAVRTALAERVQDLASFWLAGYDHSRELITPGRGQLRALVIDGCDDFIRMLEQQLRSCGVSVTVRRYDETFDPRGFDFVVVGPGPGDPRDERLPKMAAVRGVVDDLLRTNRPFVCLCLGHQVLCGRLGFEIVRRQRPNQGRQREITMFGRRRLVGFYNTFAAVSDVDQIVCNERAGAVRISRDPVTGEIDALAGPGFGSVQFHPESILSRDGIDVLREMLDEVLAAEVAVGVPPADLFMSAQAKYKRRTVDRIRKDDNTVRIPSKG